MRRVAQLVFVLILAAVTAAVLVRGGAGSQPYRVAAVFDNAKGIVPGQDVKIAGAIVGSVSAVDLAAGPKARVTMTIDRRFAPFRADAGCSILPDGLISENYIECDPGHSPATLADSAGAPTVPLSHTSLPVSLPDVLRVLSLPTDLRLRVLISELGIATSGRGADLNDLLRRANPTLLAARQALAIVDSERLRLADAVTQTDAVVSRLSLHSDQVRAFVDGAAAVAETGAAHQAGLGGAISRLPALLDAARPGLAALDRAANSAVPLLVSLRSSAPGLVHLTELIPPFAGAGIPALRSLSAAAASGRPALAAAAPVITQLARATGPLGRLSSDLYHLLASTRDAGGFEGLLRVPYAVSAATALFDGVSHLVTLAINTSPGCIAGRDQQLDVPGCSHRYSAPGHGSVPVNDPGCGPVSSVWFDVHCPVPVQSAAGRSRPQSLAPLLDYLLR